MLHLSGFRMLFLLFMILSVFLDCISIPRFCRKFKLHHGTANRYVGDIKAILTILFFHLSFKAFNAECTDSLCFMSVGIRKNVFIGRIPYTRSSFINPRALRFFSAFRRNISCFQRIKFNFPDLPCIISGFDQPSTVHVPWYLTQQNGSV